jgi:hypothetical protein
MDGSDDRGGALKYPGGKPAGLNAAWPDAARRESGEHMVDKMRRRILTAGLAGASIAAFPLRAAEPAEAGSEQWIDYMQPWRSYRQTVSTGSFLRGIGAVVTMEVPDTAIEMLARSGFVHARFEIGWGTLDFDDESRLDPRQPVSEMERVLRTCARHGLRPLILLNSHHGVPCPTRFSIRTLAEGAAAGVRRIRIDDTSGLIPGQSGLSNLTDFWAAEILATGIDENFLTLSKPLPRDLPAGASLTVATLRYEPFSVPGTARNDATVAGWLRYAETVRDFATRVLGTEDAADKGFDMEIWNELTFGTGFLSVNNYYEPEPLEYREHEIWQEIVNRTMEHVAATGERFSGIGFTNGFGSTVPWIASSLQPAGISAISKHPYPPVRRFPEDEQVNTRNLDASGQPISAISMYRSWFPEHYATGIQTETMVRDMGPFDNDINGRTHGRFARRIGGEVREVPVWLTEIGISPEDGGVRDQAAALELKAKSTARFLLFFLNMGCERLYLFETKSPDTQLGVTLESFIERAAGGATYPEGDTEAVYLSPMLQVVRRIVRHMRQDHNPALPAIRQLNFQIRHDPASAEQVPGIPAEGVEPLRNVDTLALLAYQGGPRRFVVAFYAMTKDIRKDMVEEIMTVRISGVDGSGTGLQIVDLLDDSVRPIKAAQAGPDFLTVSLPVTDMPRLLVIEGG